MNDPEIIGALSVGLKVYDANGEMVGTVDVVDREAGIMRVATNPFVEEAIVIPFTLIQRIDPRELFLDCPKAALRPDGQNASPGDIDAG
ncbi:MAG TPA: PRC-barrel domain-containing protein [Candidatus Dormibacteraeota bacterium]|nr:PRC-barrel domain-containing protein [Candidatus Dormibacteraeota bacterium]